MCGVHRLIDTLSELDSLGESIALNRPDQPANKHFALAQQPTKLVFYHRDNKFCLIASSNSHRDRKPCIFCVALNFTEVQKTAV